jgi:hypothetical protein
VRLTPPKPVDLGLQLDEGCERLEELAAVAVGIVPEPGLTVLGDTSGFLGHLRPLFGGSEPRAEAIVRLAEAGRAPPLGPEIAPEGERLVEVGGQALSVGALSVRLGRPLARPTDLARPACTGGPEFVGDERREYPDETKLSTP